MTLSKQAILEIAELSSRAEQLARGGAGERRQADVLIQRVASIKLVGISSDEMRAQYTDALNDSLNPHRSQPEQEYKKRFHAYLQGHTTEVETRDLFSGQQSIIYSAGAAGGYLVPVETEKQIFESLAQTDDLLSEETCNFVMEPTATLQPLTISGYDLSSIAATMVGEATEQLAGLVPTVSGRVLRGNLVYRVSLAASIEFEQDVPDVLPKLARAYGVAFARRVGADVVGGNGSGTQPQGINTALSPSYTTLNAGKIVLDDITSIYFSVNRIYRSQPKAAWLMNDSVYQLIRNATDGNARPLLSVIDDQEVLMGKPVRISPSLPEVLNLGSTSLSQNGVLIFGDLDHFHVRVSRPTIQRTLQQGISDITRGQCLYVGRLRADSALFDPSGGSAPPIVSAVVQHS